MCGELRRVEICPALFFFFNDTATTEIYTLSLHDALPIYLAVDHHRALVGCTRIAVEPEGHRAQQFHTIARGVGRDRKSTRLNSSHANISYAVFCLKKKNRPSSPRAFAFLGADPIRVDPDR